MAETKAIPVMIDGHRTVSGQIQVRVMTQLLALTPEDRALMPPEVLDWINENRDRMVQVYAVDTVNPRLLAIGKDNYVNHFAMGLASGLLDELFRGFMLSMGPVRELVVP